MPTAIVAKASMIIAGVKFLTWRPWAAGEADCSGSIVSCNVGEGEDGLGEGLVEDAGLRMGVGDRVGEGVDVGKGIGLGEGVGRDG